MAEHKMRDEAKMMSPESAYIIAKWKRVPSQKLQKPPFLFLIAKKFIVCVLESGRQVLRCQVIVQAKQYVHCIA